MKIAKTGEEQAIETDEATATAWINEQLGDRGGITHLLLRLTCYSDSLVTAQESQRLPVDRAAEL